MSRFSKENYYQRLRQQQQHPLPELTKHPRSSVTSAVKEATRYMNMPDIKRALTNPSSIFKTYSYRFWPISRTLKLGVVNGKALKLAANKDAPHSDLDYFNILYAYLDDSEGGEITIVPIGNKALTLAFKGLGSDKTIYLKPLHTMFIYEYKDHPDLPFSFITDQIAPEVVKLLRSLSVDNLSIKHKKGESIHIQHQPAGEFIDTDGGARLVDGFRKVSGDTNRKNLSKNLSTAVEGAIARGEQFLSAYSIALSEWQASTKRVLNLFNSEQEKYFITTIDLGYHINYTESPDQRYLSTLPLRLSILARDIFNNEVDTLTETEMSSTYLPEDFSLFLLSDTLTNIPRKVIAREVNYILMRLELADGRSFPIFINTLELKLIKGEMQNDRVGTDQTAERLNRRLIEYLEILDPSRYLQES